MTTTTTVTIPARTIEVLDGPVSIRHAFDHLTPQDGTFTGTVAVPTEQMTGEHTYDEFYDNLVNRLISNCDAYCLTYEIRGVSEDGDTLYVQVTNSLLEIAVADPDLLTEGGISPTEISDLLARFPG